MSKIVVGIRIEEELIERLHNAIWHIGRGLSVTSVVAESLERAVKKLEGENGGKPFPRRHGELPKSPVKSKKKASWRDQVQPADATAGRFFKRVEIVGGKERPLFHSNMLSGFNERFNAGMFSDSNVSWTDQSGVEWSDGATAWGG